jgi:hypothetical protein
MNSLKGELPMRNRMLSLLAVLGLSLLVNSKAQGQLPWPRSNWQPAIPVPEILGGAGQFSCVTQPNPATLAVITCTPVTFSQFPPAVLLFLRVHEHGHVNQMRFRPQVLYSGHAEADADCFSAYNLAQTDPQVLASAIVWFWNVAGPGLKVDAAHGNGFEIANMAMQCGDSAIPGFSANVRPQLRGINYQENLQSKPRLLLAKYQKPADQKEMQGQAVPEKMDEDAVVDAKGVPALCTAIDLLIEGSHSSFWDVSLHNGAIRPTISKALGADCVARGMGRYEVLCTINSSPSRSVFGTKLDACLSRSEDWAKTCRGEKCLDVQFSHPGDSANHSTITYDTTKGVMIVSAGTAKSRDAVREQR